MMEGTSLSMQHRRVRDTDAGVRSSSWANLLLMDGWREATKRKLGAEGVRRKQLRGEAFGDELAGAGQSRGWPLVGRRETKLE